MVTSSDYIFEASRNRLKPGSFPLLKESQITIDVGALTQDDASRFSTTTSDTASRETSFWPKHSLTLSSLRATRDSHQS